MRVKKLVSFNQHQVMTEGKVVGEDDGDYIVDFEHDGVTGRGRWKKSECATCLPDSCWPDWKCKGILYEVEGNLVFLDVKNELPRPNDDFSFVDFKHKGENYRIRVRNDHLSSLLEHAE